MEAAPDDTPLIHTARELNDAQPHHVVQLLQKKLGNLEGMTIAALGLAYKPDVDDLRESPALQVVEDLQKEGANVVAYEPFKKDFKHTGLQIDESIPKAIENSDVLILLVAHTEFCNLDPVEIFKLTPARVVFDTVNGWNKEKWQSAGFQYFRLGDGTLI